MPWTALILITTLALPVGCALAPPTGASARTIDLGDGKSMTIFEPAEDVETMDNEIAAILNVDVSAVAAQRGALASFDNADGQKLWPLRI